MEISKQQTANNQQPTANWFKYPVKASAHHTDYIGAVWHGAYLTWMEEARIEWLRSNGIEYADLVKIGCGLVVIDLSLRYHKAMQMGEEALVKINISQMKKVRIVCDYSIESPDESQLYLTGNLTLVAIDTDKGKIMRSLPNQLETVLDRKL